MTRRAALALLAVFAAAILAACGSRSPGNDYVALGDSYTAAPGISTPEGNDGCFRSRNNYPRLVADAAGLDLVDRSCSGASTSSIAGPQLTVTRAWREPQLDAVGAGTDVVTIGIGGNDFALYQLIATYCPALAVRHPGGSPCTVADNQLPAGRDLDSKLEQVRSRDTAALRAVRDRAPNAQVLVVGYPAIVPARGSCEDLPLAPGDVPFAHRINVGLNDALEAAAAAIGATYVDVYAATRDHDICSADPWVAGVRATHGKAAPWHPYAREQRAVAAAVEAALEDR